MKDIIVSIRYEDGNSLHIETNTKEAGSQYDHYASCLVFERPECFKDDRMILRFLSGGYEARSSDIGTHDRFPIGRILTQNTTLSFQVGFSRKDAVLIMSNVAELSLRKSIHEKDSDKPGSSVEEAPMDGNSYARKDAAWVEASTDEFPEAPGDGKIYGRKNSGWSEVPAGGLSGLGVETSVTGIPDGKLLGVSGGKLGGFDASSAGGVPVVEGTAARPGTNGVNFAITVPEVPAGPHYIRFVPPALYNGIYSFSVNGIPVSVKARNGGTLKRPWLIGDEVLLLRYGNVLYCEQGGGEPYNLLPLNPAAGWSNGITAAANPDGSVRIYGTATADRDIFLFGGYGLTTDFGTLQAGGDYCFDPGYTDPGAIAYLMVGKKEGGSEAAISSKRAVYYSSDYRLVSLYCRISKGSTVDFVFNPVLYCISPSYDDYISPNVMDTFKVPAGGAMEIYYSPFMSALDGKPFGFVSLTNAPRGKRYGRKWVPNTTSAGSQTATLAVYRGRSAVYRKNIRLDIFGKPALTGNKTVLMIGDSITEFAADSITQIKNLCAADYGSNKFEFVGTRGSGSYKHEGRSGWYAQGYAGNTEGNPFWNTSAKKLDFADYTLRTGIKPDIVHIMLGTNDLLNSLSPPETVVSLKAIADQIRKDWPEAKMMLSIPPQFGNQDGLANAGYNSRMNNLDILGAELACEMWNIFGKSDVALVPVYYCFDREYGYPSDNEPANPYSGIQASVQTDAVHPSFDGKKQMGSVWYWYLLSLFS